MAHIQNIIDAKSTRFGNEFEKINNDLVKLSLIVKSSSKNFVNFETIAKKYKDDISWYLSAMQDVKKYQNIYPKLEQEIRNCKLFITTQKQNLTTLNQEKTR